MDETAVTPKVVKSPVSPSEPRSRLVAFLLNLSFGYFGLHQVYLGNKTQGWVRFGLGVASFPLMFVLIGFLILPVLLVWQVVDFFLLQLSMKTDGEGQMLTVTNRDASWQKGIFITILVVYGLYLLGIIFAIMLGALSNIQNDYHFDVNSSNSSSGGYHYQL